MKNIGTYDPGMAAGFISSFEGCKLTAYKCAAGVWTIGYGHTQGVREGDTCMQDLAKAWLVDDIRETQLLLAHYVNVPVTQNEFIALVSLAFNVGVGALMKSKLLRKLNSGDREGAADEFLDFDLAGGKKVAGLTRRRKAEHDLFLKD
ncbi:lysozyme [Parasutterella secunda]|uniref:Lysozyme n=1 Tax=Parasutterella secunda TaxID=626947 RepID=A0ABS2GVB9_9BURK|nr:lysozyme [Parasutterella secunda]MBM6929339.1 lysozyme [Parasutterella secunda]